jgi:small subunit ribosomal protein S17
MQSRGIRKVRKGVVTSDKMQKTVVVKVEHLRKHPLYKKYVKQTKKFYAHDEQNEAHIGDFVEIVETKPLSKLKCWRLSKILERSVESSDVTSGSADALETGL